jgi:DNA repair protein RadA/Sms
MSSERGRDKEAMPSERGREAVSLMAEMDVDVIVATAEKEKPGVMIVDSIQTLYTRDLSGMAGSVGQVRESAFRLIELAKREGIAVFVVGHVTKEGNIAGPKVLEHMVDCVLQLEGERTGQWRLLRSIKNRFGPTDETGVFMMEERGMMDVSNPSGAFLEESQGGKPGSVVVAVMEGTRPVLIEIQALTVKSELAMPRRVVHGLPLSKLQVLCAVLQKSCRLPLGTQDVFVNVAGGLTVREPAADLGIALAIASSVTNKALPSKSVAMGEVGLLGDLRRISFISKRAAEAKKLGYPLVISPEKYKSVAEAVSKLLR